MCWHVPASRSYKKKRVTNRYFGFGAVGTIFFQNTPILGQLRHESSLLVSDAIFGQPHEIIPNPQAIEVSVVIKSKGGPLQVGLSKCGYLQGITIF